MDYANYYPPFLWLVDLVKHLVDYLGHYKAERQTIHNFRLDGPFAAWLKHTHQCSPNTEAWLPRVTDFRRVIAANIRFLSDQIAAAGLETQWYFVRREVDPELLNDIPPEEVRTQRTVVTPYVYDCFKHMPWAGLLDPQSRDGLVSVTQEHAKARDSASSIQTLRCNGADEADAAIEVGDVVGVPSDTDTWQGSHSEWYAYVQGLQKTDQGIKLDLIWMYRPSDTACQDMEYRQSKELFLGTHCNCGDKPIYSNEVLSRPKVSFFCQGWNDDCDFFVRQIYDDNESAWITLKEADFQCPCRSVEADPQWQPGDTVLVETEEDKLEPFEIVDPLPPMDLRPYELCGRKLLWKTSVQSNAPPNELLYSVTYVKLLRSRICRPCPIRFFHADEIIPPPYCRKGTANFFYITKEITNQGAIQPLSTPWPPMKQGPEPEKVQKPLIGLDIFCGGGNLGRGLEEGGAVEMRFAVDYFKEALHTYKANTGPQDNIFYYNGSANDYLRQAIKRMRPGIVAQKGEIHFISAGSPCQGFSLANQDKNSRESQRNISMVASVISYIDFYRPKYALMENVTTMAKCGRSQDNSQNVFAQVLCAIVGMGYQVRPFRLDAWNFGSPQSRTRLFITIAAPGLPPMRDPAPSHSHPDHINAASLGKAANGLPIGGRYWEPTPFEYVSMTEATKDLPLNDHGKISSVFFPDHRMTRNMTTSNRVRVASVPKNPPGMSFVKAVKAGWMPRRLIASYKWDNKLRAREQSHAWQRVDGNGLLPTVLTACTAEDGISGNCVHWEADRLITVMEARRAQGFPDHEVIVGQPPAQWKIIGNSVARPVALALGVELRKAWEKALEAEHPSTEVPMPISLPLRTHGYAQDDVDKPCTRELERHEIAASERPNRYHDKRLRTPKEPQTPASVGPSLTSTASRLLGFMRSTFSGGSGGTSTSNAQKLPFQILGDDHANIHRTRDTYGTYSASKATIPSPQTMARIQQAKQRRLIRETTVSEVTISRKRTRVREYA